jgi:hypothetical protein
MPEVPIVDDICFPGGFCLSYGWDAIGKIPSGADIAIDFWSQIGPAMAPLTPFFQALDTVLQIFKCLKAIPDAITSLNPSELLKCVPALAKLIDQLLGLIPQMSIPKMIKAALKNMAVMIRGIAQEFQTIQREIDRIQQSIERAADLNDVSMQGFLVCAQDDLQKNVDATSEALKGVGRIILLLNIFISLIGAEEIPCFGSLIDNNASEGLDVVIDLLLTLADLLDLMAKVIPDPDAALTLALGDQTC